MNVSGGDGPTQSVLTKEDGTVEQFGGQRYTTQVQISNVRNYYIVYITVSATSREIIRTLICIDFTAISRIRLDLWSTALLYIKH